MQCPYCASDNVEYAGIDDGGGDYADEICDVWHCRECRMDFTGHCIEPPIEEE